MNKNILNSTRKRLTTFYTVVVGIVFLVFVLFIYNYFYNLTYRQIDKDLRNQYQKIAIEMENGSSPFTRSLTLRNSIKGNIIYIWKGDKLIVESPAEVSDYIRPYNLSETTKEGISSYEYDGYNFRQIKGSTGNYTIEIIKLVDTQVELLRSLLNVLIVSTILALLVVYFVSKLLTKKSLEPIEESWKNQAMFVQDASHELRTPLTIIFSKVEQIIKNQSSTVEDEMDNLVIVMKEIRRLRKLVSDLLKLSKEDAIVSINKENVDVVELVENIVSEYEDICMLQEKELIFNNNLRERSIYTDKEKLKQIVIIFLDNAIKYTNYNDSISISLCQESSYIKIEVKDSGIGIKEEDINNIFNRFYRCSLDREINKEGAGIGLSIAKTILSNLNGKVEVKSKVGIGSIFNIYIPKK